MEIIIGRKGTQKLAITDRTVSREHCKLTENEDGTFTIENLSPSGTTVDGRPVIRATVTLGSTIGLGANYISTLGQLIGRNSKAASKNSKNIANEEKEKPSFNISHLRGIWEEFNNKNIEILEKQRKINITRAGFSIFTVCAMPIIFFFGPVGIGLTIIGIIGTIYSFVGMKNSESPTERQERTENFEDMWACPNPKCGRTLPAKNFKMLVKNYQSCPYCKCKYILK